MLQQILSNMYVDPDILEALNDEQKKTLFVKMREEQVRRWKEREEKEEKEGGIEIPRPRKATFKKVSWLLGRDGDVHVCVFGETDEFKSSKLLLSELRGRKENNLNATNRIDLSLISRTDSAGSSGPTLDQSSSDRSPLIKHIWREEPQTTGHLKSSLDIRGNQNDSNKTGIKLLLRKAEDMNHSNTLPDNNSHSTEEVKNQTDDSSNLITTKSCRMDAEPSIVARLNQFTLQKNTTEQDGQEREVASEQEPSFPFRNRVAQLRMNFNTPNTRVPSPYTKPPVPTKPAHLLTAASVR